MNALYSPEVKRNFHFDLLAGVFFGLFFGAVNPFILVQARRLGATPFQVSFLAALPCIWMLFSPVWTALFGRKNPFRTVLIFDGFARLLLLLLLVDSSPGWYILLFSFHYLFSSVSATVYGKAMRLAYPTGTRGRMMGLVRVGNSIGMLLSAGLAGVLLPLWGVHRFFAGFAIFGVLSSVTFGQLKQAGNESPLEQSLTGPLSLNVLRTDSEFRRYIFALFLVGLGNLMAMPIYALYQVDVLKFGDSFISVLAMVTSLSALVFYYIWGRFIDRRSSPELSIIIYFCNLFVPLIYLVTGNPWAFLLVAFIQGLLNAGFDLAALNNVIYFAKDREIGSYMAAHISLLGLRGTIGPLLGPFLMQTISAKGLFLLTFVLILAGFLHSLDFRRTVARKALWVR